MNTMKIERALLMMALTMLMFSCKKDSVMNEIAELKKPTTEVDRYSYALGYDVGNNFLKSLTADSVQINMDYVYRGIADGVKEVEDAANFLLTKDERDAAIKELQAAMQVKQEAIMQERLKKYEERSKTALEDGKKFLEANKANSGVVVEKSGMQYKVLVAGKGNIPKPTDIVKFHIVGRFIDGEEFQSTRKMEMSPEAPLNDISIKGIREALGKMPVGSKWEVVLPPNLAYGEQDTGIIPPNSVVIFEIELLDIVKKEATAKK